MLIGVCGLPHHTVMIAVKIRDAIHGKYRLSLLLISSQTAFAGRYDMELAFSARVKEDLCQPLISPQGVVLGDAEK